MGLSANTQNLFWTFTGLWGVELGDDQELELPDGFLLCEKTPQLSAALNTGSLSDRHKERARSLDCFFCLRSSYPRPVDEERQRFQDGLMALQIIKPVETLGFIFQGTALPNGSVTVDHVEERPTMNPGEWALLRRFDGSLRVQLRELLPKVLARMKIGSAEERNSVILLQLALEHFHPLIKGMFGVMGLEAQLGSYGRRDFESKLCDRLGRSCLVFPDWNSPSLAPPNYTVAGVALHLHTLRSKVAHGVDLRKAAQDKNVPVDLTQMRELIEELEPRPYASILSEAAIYILCLVLQKELKTA